MLLYRWYGKQEVIVTFVYEKLDEESALKLAHEIGKFQQILSFSRSYVIDREHDIALYCLGGRGFSPIERGEPPDYYVVLWSGALISFEAYMYYDNFKKLTFRLVRLSVPKSMQEKFLDIQIAIESALAVFWQQLTKGDSVVVRFPDVKYY